MKPLLQTKFGNKEGNCLSTCIACLLDFDDPDQVPNFCAKHPDNGDWLEALNAWLLERFGIQALLLDKNAAELIYGLWIATGKSPRGDFDHCVIYSGKNPEHDPHPDKTFIEGSIKDCLLLIPLNPALSVKLKT